MVLFFATSISTFICSLIVYKSRIDFCALIFASCKFIRLPLILVVFFFFTIPWDFSTFLIMLSASNAGSLQLRWCSFNLFYYFALWQHPVLCWAEVMGVHILSLFVILKGKAFFYYIMLAMGFFISCFFYQADKNFLFLGCWEFLLRINGLLVFFQILFLTSIEMMVRFFFFCPGI